MNKWALILGGSSGIGLATAVKLGEKGFHLLIIHRDRRSELGAIDEAFDAIRKNGNKVFTFNFDAVNEDRVNEYFPQLLEALAGDKIDLLLHSISRGNLKRLTGNALSRQDLALTIDAMASSLSTWVNNLFINKAFNQNAGIVTLTSAGSDKYWENYAAVGMAKSAMETMTKYLAAELAPHQVRANCIHAGITDTPSLKMIPGYEELKAISIAKNPNKRMTTPQDVANVIYLLTLPEANWITGSVIHVDGGEHLVG